MTYKELIEAEIARLTERIERGQGTWPQSDYIVDEIWSGWLAIRWTLQEILREAEYDEDPWWAPCKECGTLAPNKSKLLHKENLETEPT